VEQEAQSQPSRSWGVHQRNLLCISSQSDYQGVSNVKRRIIGIIGIAVIALAAGIGSHGGVRAEAAFNTPGGTFADACAFQAWYDAQTGVHHNWTGSQWAGIVCTNG
jgi:hypothetical protein